MKNLTISELKSIASKHRDIIFIENGEALVLVHDYIADGSSINKLICPLDHYIEHLENKDLLLSKLYNVDLGKYLSWKEAWSNGIRCCALTKKGEECRGFVSPLKYKLPNTPQDWGDKVDMYCHVHENQSMNVTKYR